MMNNKAPDEICINELAGELLRQHRCTAELTIGELALRCGLSQQQVSRYERGITQITIDALLMFCMALNIGPGAFFQTLQQLSVTENALAKPI